jgi:hypothetical protein
MATKYRCYLLDMERIAAMQVIEASDDAAAVLEADRILAASPSTSAEVWDCERRVSIISRKNSAA